MDYSQLFDHNCNTYSSYLDTITNGSELFLTNNNKHQIYNSSYTALDDDLYGPKGYYLGADQIPVIFDSECTVAITPFTEDFVGPIHKCNKTTGGLTCKAQVE